VDSGMDIRGGRLGYQHEHKWDKFYTNEIRELILLWRFVEHDFGGSLDTAFLGDIRMLVAAGIWEGTMYTNVGMTTKWIQPFAMSWRKRERRQLRKGLEDARSIVHDHHEDDLIKK
jgi:hypothetical protein